MLVARCEISPRPKRFVRRERDIRHARIVVFQHREQSAFELDLVLKDANLPVPISARDDFACVEGGVRVGVDVRGDRGGDGVDASRRGGLGVEFGEVFARARRRRVEDVFGGFVFVFAAVSTTATVSESTCFAGKAAVRAGYRHFGVRRGAPDAVGAPRGVLSKRYLSRVALLCLRQGRKICAFARDPKANASGARYRGLDASEHAV